MSVSPVGSDSAAFTQAVQPKAAPAAAQVEGRDAEHDGDSDDGGAPAVKPPAPTVNLNGERIGSTISISV